MSSESPRRGFLGRRVIFMITDADVRKVAGEAAERVTPRVLDRISVALYRKFLHSIQVELSLQVLRQVPPLVTEADVAAMPPMPGGDTSTPEWQAWKDQIVREDVTKAYGPVFAEHYLGAVDDAGRNRGGDFDWGLVEPWEGNDVATALYACGCAITRSMYGAREVRDVQICQEHWSIFSEDKSLRQMAEEVEAAQRALGARQEPPAASDAQERPHGD